MNLLFSKLKLIRGLQVQVSDTTTDFAKTNGFSELFRTPVGEVESFKRFSEPLFSFCTV
jgi:hypothetical protein